MIYLSGKSETYKEVPVTTSRVVLHIDTPCPTHQVRVTFTSLTPYTMTTDTNESSKQSHLLKLAPSSAKSTNQGLAEKRSLYFDPACSSTYQVVTGLQREDADRHYRVALTGGTKSEVQDEGETEDDEALRNPFWRPPETQQSWFQSAITFGTRKK